MKFINKILVPTDFSDLSLAAMEYASSFSKIYDAKIYLIHVVEEPPSLTFHTVDFSSETMLRDTLEQAGNDLRDFIAGSLPEMKNIIPVIKRGDARKEIVKYAAEEHFDLIIMATHGRTGLAHILLGSVAETIVRSSTVPVLTVKPEEMKNGFVENEDIEEQLHISR